MDSFNELILPGNVIAHLIPGVTLLIMLGFLFPSVSAAARYKMDVLKDNQALSATAGLVFLLLAFCVGLLLDALRMIYPWRVLKWWFNLENICADQFIAMNKAQNLPVIKAFVENYYRYFQFYFSMALIATGSAIVFLIRGIYTRRYGMVLISITVGVLSWLLYTAAAQNHHLFILVVNSLH